MEWWKLCGILLLVYIKVQLLYSEMIIISMIVGVGLDLILYNHPIFVNQLKKYTLVCVSQWN